MYKKNKVQKSIKSKIVFRVTAFVGAVMVIAVGCVIYLQSVHLKQQATLLLKNKIQILANGVEQRLGYLEKSTQRLANNELIVNAFIDEQAKQRYLIPVINNFKNGKPLNHLSVVDFDARAIFQTDKNRVLSQYAHELRLALSLFKPVAYFDVQNSEVVYVVPITYYSTTQGAVIAIFDMNTIIKNHTHLKDFKYAMFFKDGVQFYEQNHEQSKAYYTYKLTNTSSYDYLSRFNITMQMGILENVYLKPLKEDILPFVLLGILVLVVGMWFAYFLAKSIVDPILVLYKRVYESSSLPMKKAYQHLGTNDELDALGEMFYNKEKELEAFNQSLNFKVEEATKELKIAKNEAERANELKSEFLANMSHEIRTPMNAIIGLGQILDEMIVQQEQKMILSKINSSSHMLLGIINDILDYSKIEAGKLELEQEKFCFEHIIKNLKSMFEDKAKAKNIEFETILSKDIKTVFIGDELRLTQVLNNLLSNAIKFTQQGRVQLTIKKLHQDEAHETMRLKISVKDSGIGMSQEELKKLFVPFTQADSSTTRKYGGSGLGLVICKNIIKAFGETIEVHSQINKGTEFFFEITLPYINESIKVKKRIQDRTLGFKNVVILLVEDNEVNQMVASMMLKKVGIEVEVANNGQEGVQMFLKDQNRYDLILMDLQMPVMSGYEATQKIREHNQKIPIVALTAAAMIEDRQKVLDAGMNEHLSKPIDTNKLYKLLEKFCPQNSSESGIEIAKEHKLNQQVKESEVLDTSFLEQMVDSKDKCNAILKRFLQQLQSDSIQNIAYHIQNESKEAHTVVHSLKGVSGNVGAKLLYGITQNIDACYKQHQSITQAQIQILTTAVEKTIKKIKELDVNQKEDVGHEKSLSKKELKALYDSTQKSLKQSLLINEKELSILLYNLREYILQEEIEEFEQYVYDFEFDKALAIMNGWKI